MEIPHDEYNEMRNIAAQCYYNWLTANDILDTFHRPETIESLFYHKKYSTSQMDIVEQILHFLESYGLLKHAGGTYSLTRDLAETEKLWNNRFPIPDKYPTYNFIKQGISLLNDRLEGGTGKWDRSNDHFTIERAFSHAGWRFSNPKIINFDTVKTRFSNPTIAVYGLFPQTLFDFILKNFPEYDSIKILVPDLETKNQIISYCELITDYNFLSTNVEIVHNIINQKFDLMFVPNGLFYKNTVKDQVKLFEKLVKKNGFLYLPNLSANNNSGLEPLLLLDDHNPNFKEILNFFKILKTSSFGSSSKSHQKSPFIYFYKKE